MRWIGWIVALLMTVGWVATELPVAEPLQAGLANTDWRRTRDGWQQPTWLGASIPAREPALHPGVVGMFQMLVSLMALVGFSKGRIQKAEGRIRKAEGGRRKVKGDVGACRPGVGAGRGGDA